MPPVVPRLSPLVPRKQPWRDEPRAAHVAPIARDGRDLAAGESWETDAAHGIGAAQPDASPYHRGTVWLYWY